MKLFLATSNSGKVREVAAILDGTGLEVALEPMWLGDIESGTTHLENARIKAESALRMLHAPVLAEDSGIEVDALGGLPGIRSARFAGPAASDHANNAKLLRLLDGVPPERRTARYRAVAVLLMPTGAEVMGEGVWEGHIATEPKGSGGFGYDPLFVPAGSGTTAAELTPDEKNAVSHRAHALRRLVDQARAAGVL